MKKIIYLIGLLCLTNLYFFSQDINLPQVKANTNFDLIKALEIRSGSRRFIKKEVPMQQISTIFWAGNGIILKKGNKTIHGFDTKTGASNKNRHTIPYGWEKPYIKLYLLLKDAAYEYIAEDHKLKLIKKKNLISGSGVSSSNPAGAIVISVNYNNMPGGKKTINSNVGYMTAGFAAQNMFTAGSLYNIQMLTQVYFKNDYLKKELKILKNEELLTLISFGYTK